MRFSNTLIVGEEDSHDDLQLHPFLGLQYFVLKLTILTF